MNLAPIVLFVYNRPWHTQQTLEALANNDLAKDSKLYVFADGCKQGDSEDALQKIKETREVVKSKNWCKEVILIESETNLGLANSIINGVTKIINKYGKIIVLEDDLVTSKYFLKFMNDSLNFYERQEEVISISAYIYPIINLPEQFFIKGADCWGWATWKRGWDLFEPSGEKLLKKLEDKNLKHQFDINGTYPYTIMLREQIDGKNNSWAIRWYASAFLKNKLCLYPGKSFVNNIGIDGSGTHSGTSNKFDNIIEDVAITVKDIKIEENTIALNEISYYFKSLNLFERKRPNNSFIKKIFKKLFPSIIFSIYHKLH